MTTLPVRCLLIAATAALFLLPACSGGGEPAASGQSPSSTTSTTPTATTPTTTAPTTTAPTTTRTADAVAVCRGLIGDGGQDELIWRIPEALRAVGPNLDVTAAANLATISGEIEQLIAVAPSSMMADLRQLQLPFKQAADVLSSGGGALTLDTGAAREAILPLLTECNNAGYRAGS